jgi:hypothetical protein
LLGGDVEDDVGELIASQTASMIDEDDVEAYTGCEDDGVPIVEEMQDDGF